MAVRLEKAMAERRRNMVRGDLLCGAVLWMELGGRWSASGLVSISGD